MYNPCPHTNALGIFDMDNAWYNGYVNLQCDV